MGEGFINKNVFIVNKKRQRGCLKDRVLKDRSYLLDGECWKRWSPFYTNTCLIGDNKRRKADTRSAEFPRCLGDIQ